MNRGISPLVFGGLIAAALLAAVVLVVRSTMADTGSIDAATGRALAGYGASNVGQAIGELPTFAAPSLDPIVTIQATPVVYAMPTQQVVTIDPPTATSTETPLPTATWTPEPTMTPTPTWTPAPRWSVVQQGEWKYIGLPIGMMPCYVWGRHVDGSVSVQHQDWAWWVMAQPEPDRIAMFNACFGGGHG